jgi:hypothetical protein
MRSIVLMLPVCALLVGSSVIFATPAMAMLAGSQHVHGIGHHYLHDGNYNWNEIVSWLLNLKQQYQQSRSVPIPGTLLLFGAGFLGLAFWRGGKRR